jgi:hypothetical protein
MGTTTWHPRGVVTDSILLHQAMANAIQAKIFEDKQTVERIHDGAASNTRSPKPEKKQVCLLFVHPVSLYTSWLCLCALVVDLQYHSFRFVFVCNVGFNG